MSETPPEGTMVCQACGGDGEVTETFLVADTLLTPSSGPDLETETSTCPDCGGTGVVDDPTAG